MSLAVHRHGSLGGNAVFHMAAEALFVCACVSANLGYGSILSHQL